MATHPRGWVRLPGLEQGLAGCTVVARQGAASPPAVDAVAMKHGKSRRCPSCAPPRVALLGRTKTSAASTLMRSVGPVVRILDGKRMAMQTGSLAMVHGRDAVATQYILSTGDGLKVVGTYALADTTEVIKGQSGRDGPAQRLIRPSVGQAVSQASIAATRLATNPYPTSGHCFVHLGPKAFSKRPGTARHIVTTAH